MILLLGGTSETAPIAQGLASAGYKVLVSKCSDFPLAIGSHPDISLRVGPLDYTKIITLIETKNIKAIVDATHPYATEISTIANKACKELFLPYYRFERPCSDYTDCDIYLADTHTQAAKTACSFHCPVLLTIGSKNIASYVSQAAIEACELFVRILPFEKSIASCKDLNINEGHLIQARGPFTTEDNIKLIKKYHIGVLISKDSGSAGGMEAKLQAARQTNCRVVIVKRPVLETCKPFYSISQLIDSVILLNV